MFRRSFFQTIVGGIASLFVHKEIEESYLYDWQKGFSTDPKLQGNLPYLYNCPTMRISVNGEELDLYDLHVTKCQTGPYGWVEGVEWNNGKPVIDFSIDEVKTWRLSGDVKFRLGEMWPPKVETTNIHNREFRTFVPKELK